MNGHIEYKLSDEALDLVTGGTQGNTTDNTQGSTLHVCSNKACPSYDQKVIFYLYGGGRARCSVCNTEINI